MRARASAVLLACVGTTLVLGVVARSAPLARAPLSFAPATLYDSSNDYYRHLVVGDLNGDGKPDLVTDAYVDEGLAVSVLLNRGDGRFGDVHGEGAHYYAGDAYPAGLGDFNGDGSTDIVALNGERGIVSVLLNAGNGNFETPRDFEAGLVPVDVAIGDLNGDGASDMATADYGGNTVSVLLNRGDGTFLPLVAFRTGGRPESVAVRDVSGDTRPDLVVTNEGSSSVSVLLNLGGGDFQPASAYTTGRSPGPASVVDLNTDGHPDLITDNFKGRSVSVLLNRGDGTFSQKRDYRVGRNPTSLIVGDVNGDGGPDLAVVNNGSRTVSVLRNRGDGTFSTRLDLPTGPDPRSLAIADLNGDSRSDLVVADSTGGFDYEFPSVLVLLNRGGGRFERGLRYRSGSEEYDAGGDPVLLAAADLSGDGRPDLVSTNFYFPAGDSDIAVLLNTPGLCNVQKVVRMTLAEAKQTLARANCGVGKIRRAYSKVRKGRVISQTLFWGVVRKRGTKVGLLASRGRRR